MDMAISYHTKKHFSMHFTLLKWYRLRYLNRTGQTGYSAPKNSRAMQNGKKESCNRIDETPETRQIGN